VCCIQNCQTTGFKFSLLPSFMIATFYSAYDIRNMQTASCADCCNGRTNCRLMWFETKPWKKTTVTDMNSVKTVLKPVDIEFLVFQNLMSVWFNLVFKKLKTKICNGFCTHLMNAVSFLVIYLHILYIYLYIYTSIGCQLANTLAALVRHCAIGYNNAASLTVCWLSNIYM